jgi:hypothetical protein
VGALACAAAAYLLAPLHAPRGAAARAALVLCDVSPSVTRTRPQWRAWLAAELSREAARAVELGAELVVLTYGRERRFLEAPRGAREAGAWAAALASLDADGATRALDAQASDVWAALEALEARLGERAPARLAWLSPGDFTGRDPGARLASLAARAAQFEHFSPPPAELADLALVELELPRAPAVGAPLVARLWLAGRGGGAARLDVRLESAAGSPAWSQRLQAADFGAEPVPLEVSLGPAPAGVSHLELALVADGSDAVPENDRLRGTLRAGDDIALALAAGDAHAQLARELAAELARVGGLAPRVLDAESLALAPAEFDVLVQVAPDLARLDASVLEAFLARGGGWLVCLGDEVLAREALASPAARLAPLDLTPHGGEARDVLLLVDRSGSMAAPANDGRRSALDEARAAALRLAQLSPDDERVFLRTFAAELGPAIEIARGAGDVLAPLLPQGGTDIAGALEALARERAGEGRAALVLLVSDGRDQVHDPAALDALRERLRAARCTLEVLAVGAEPDLAFLGALAGEGRRVCVVAREDDLGAALARVASAARERREGPYAVALAEPLAEQARAALGAAAAGGFTPLLSYQAARARPGAARALVAGAAREDLLALARSGRGAAAALATLPRAADAAWLAELARWLAAGRAPAQPRLVRRGARLELHDVPADWPVSVRAARADGRGPQALLLPPAETVVDPRDRRVGTWPQEAPPDGLFRLSGPDPADPPLALLAAEGAAAPEFAHPPARVRLPPDGEAKADVALPPARAGHPLGRPVLMASLALLTLGGLLLGRSAEDSPVAPASDR